MFSFTTKTILFFFHQWKESPSQAARAQGFHPPEAGVNRPGSTRVFHSVCLCCKAAQFIVGKIAKFVREQES